MKLRSINLPVCPRLYSGRWQRWQQLHLSMWSPSLSPSSSTLIGSSQKVKHLCIVFVIIHLLFTIIISIISSPSLLPSSLQRWTSTFQACLPCPPTQPPQNLNPAWRGNVPAAWWGRTGTVTPPVKTGTCLAPTSASACPSPSRPVPRH